MLNSNNVKLCVHQLKSFYLIVVAFPKGFLSRALLTLWSVMPIKTNEMHMMTVWKLINLDVKSCIEIVVLFYFLGQNAFSNQ
jgi:hypothetical protein